MGLDLNRGVMQRPVKDSAGNPTGAWIAMYTGVPADNFAGADPGVYYDDAGNEVTEEVAAAAGFDVKMHAIERKAKLRRLEFDKEEAKRRKEDEAALKAEMELDVSGRTEELLKRAKGRYELRHMGGRHWNVFGAQGEQLSEKNLLKPDAVAFLEKLERQHAPEDPEEREAASA